MTEPPDFEQITRALTLFDEKFFNSLKSSVSACGQEFDVGQAEHDSTAAFYDRVCELQTLVTGFADTLRQVWSTVFAQIIAEQYAERSNVLRNSTHETTPDFEQIAWHLKNTIDDHPRLVDQNVRLIADALSQAWNARGEVDAQTVLSHPLTLGTGINTSEIRRNGDLVKAIKAQDR